MYYLGYYSRVPTFGNPHMGSSLNEGLFQDAVVDFGFFFRGGLWTLGFEAPGLGDPWF